MMCKYCSCEVEVLAYRLGEVMCLECSKLAFYKILENGNHVLTIKPKVVA